MGDEQRKRKKSALYKPTTTERLFFVFCVPPTTSYGVLLLPSCRHLIDNVCIFRVPATFRGCGGVKRVFVAVEAAQK